MTATAAGMSRMALIACCLLCPFRELSASGWRQLIPLEDGEHEDVEEFGAGSRCASGRLASTPK